MLNVKEYGVKGDGIADDTAAIQQIIHLISTTRNTATIYFPSGRYKVSSTLSIHKSGIRLVGEQRGRHGVENATVIEFYGAGECIVLGNSSLSSYGGYQNFNIENLSIIYKGSTISALNNPFSKSISQAFYGTGTYAIRDWKGGGMTLRNVQIEHFEYAFWGYESDVNTFDNVMLLYNKKGIHLDEFCDQFTAKELYTFGNDTVLDVYKPRGLRFTNCQFVKEGSPIDYPIELDGCYNVQFLGCWFEGFGGNFGVSVPAYIRIGKTLETRSIVLRDSILKAGDKYHGTIAHYNYFLEIVNGTRLLIDEIIGFDQNLKKLIAFSGNSQIQDVIIRTHSSTNYTNGKYHDQLGTGRAAIFMEKYDDQGRSIIDTFVRAYRRTNQTIHAETWTILEFDSISDDEFLEFDTTSHRFVAKYTGKYEVIAYVMTDIQPDGNRCRMGIFRNQPITGGAAMTYIDDNTIGANTYSAIKGCDILKLSAGDYIDLRIFSSAAITLLGGGANFYLRLRRI